MAVTWQEPEQRAQGKVRVHLPHSGSAGCCALGTATALRLGEWEMWAAISNIQNCDKTDKRGKRKKKQEAFSYSELGYAQLTIWLSHGVDHQDRSKLKTFRPLAMNSPYRRASQAIIHIHHPFLFGVAILLTSLAPRSLWISICEV